MNLAGRLLQKFIDGMIICMILLIVMFIVGIVLYQYEQFYGIILITVSSLSIIEIFLVYFILLYYDNRRPTNFIQIV